MFAREHQNNFISKIVMAKSNPMSVKYYTWRAEFQERGALHVHGTIWVNTRKLEMLREVNGRLCMKNAPGKGPLKGITEVFNKLRHDKPLESMEISCLTRFIDEFFTVCTHPKIVGKDVAEIAKQVNQHHHTKTCRKHGTSCRFNYPKPPSPEIKP